MDSLAMTADDAAYNDIVCRILSAGSPDAIILFGSRARGDARPESDVDILVIEESSEPRWQRSSKYYRALRGICWPKDVLVWTPDEIHEWSNVKHHFITEVMREGRPLYERRGCPLEGMGAEGRERPADFAQSTGLR